MNSKISLAIIIVLTALFVACVAIIGAAPQTEDYSGDTITFNVTTGANTINDTVNQIKTLSYFKGHDEGTLEWMESLADRMVFYSNDTLVVMSSSDAERIPPEPGITDVYIYNIFKAEVIENHSLGKDLQMVYLVENVTFINQEIVGNGLA